MHRYALVVLLSIATASAAVPPGTGAAASSGTDANFKIISETLSPHELPGCPTPGGCPAVPVPASIVTKLAGWPPTLQGTHWIAPDPDQSNATRNGTFFGSVVYETTFTATAGLTLNARILVDDNVSVSLNGKIIFTNTTAQNVYAPIIKLTNLIVGVNRLDFNVSNSGGGPTGLDVAFSDAAAPPSGPELYLYYLNTPAPMTFSSTAPGATTTQVLYLINNGDADANFASITAPAAPFFIDSTVAPACSLTTPLKPANYCAINILFKPTAATPASPSGTLNFSLKSPANPATFSLSMSGKVAGPSTGSPNLIFTPTSMAFPATPVGVDSSEQIVKITNNGTAPAIFSDIEIPSNYVIDWHPPTTVTPACSQSLDADPNLLPGASCAVGITFHGTATPPAVDPYFGSSLAIDLCPPCDGMTFYKMPLTGTTGSGPAPTFSPNPLLFPPTAPGTPSAPILVTVTNKGSLATISLLPGDSIFKLAGPTTCTPSFTATCTLSITFNPPATAAPGTVYSDDSTNAKPNPLILYLREATGDAGFSFNATGTVGASAAAPAITFTPSVISMSAQVNTEVQFTPSVQIKNTGTAPLSIADITTAGYPVVVLDKINNCRGLTLAIGQTCTFDVYFHPTVLGVTNATIDVTGNLPSGKQSIPFTGTATALPGPQITFKDKFNQSVDNLSFVQAKDTAQIQTITVNNTGGGVLKISGVSFTDTSSFSLANNNCLNAQLSAGGSCSLDIRFNPAVYGPAQSTLVVTDKTNSVTKNLILNGNGTGAPILSMSTKSLTFTSLIGGAAPPKAIITLKNIGGAALTINNIQLGPNHAGFNLDIGACYGNTLQPQFSGGLSCALGVTFAPSVTGTVCTSIALFHNGPSSPDIVSLSGFTTQAGGSCAPPSIPHTGYRTLSVDAAPDPVDGATGQFYEDETDLRLGGPMNLNFVRYYSSSLSGAGFKTALGPNWMTNFDLSMAISGTDAQVILFRGKIISFSKASGSWTLVSPADTGYQFAESPSGYQFMSPLSRSIYTLDSFGKLARIEDRSGNAVTVTQGLAGPTQISDGLGRTLALTYSGGLLTGVQDQAGRSVAYTYNGTDLVSATDPAKNITQYSYIATGTLTTLMVKKQLPLGNVPTTQTYDVSGKVLTQSDPNGNVTTIGYDGKGGTTITGPLGDTTRQANNTDGDLGQLTDPNGAAANIGFDNAYRRTSVTDRLGNTTQFTYHAPTGNIASRTDEAGNTTTYTYTPQLQAGFTFYNLTGIAYPDGTASALEYSPNGKLTSITSRDGTTRKFTYDSNGRTASATGPDNQTTSYTYNPDSTLASAQDPLGNITTYSYNSAKQVTSLTDPNGGVTAYTYDPEGRLLTKSDPVGSVDTTHYDANGQRDTWTSPTGGVFGFAYTAAAQLASYSDPLGNKTTYSYDAEGRLATIRNAAGEVNSQAYDMVGHLTSVSGNNGVLFSYTYDAEGRLLSSTDAAGQKTSYQYDPTGLLTSATSPGGNQWTVTYDKLGNLLGVTNPLGETQSLTRDSMGRITQVTLPGGLSSTIKLNPLGQAASISSPNGNTWTIDHDALGRISAITDPLGNSTSRTYTGTQLTGMAFPLGSVTFTNDADGRILRRSYSDGTTINTAYDPMGLLISADGLTISRDAKGLPSNINGMAVSYTVADHPASITYAPGKTVNYAYDSDGRLTSITDWAGGQTTLTYDPAGHPATLIYPNGVATSFTYDPDGRVVNIAAGTLATINLTRDADGKILSADRNLPAAPALQSASQQFAYNAAGQLTSNASFDAMGRALSQNGRSYTWNLANQLTGFQDSVTSAALTYDGLGEVSSSTASGTRQSFVFNHLTDFPSLSIVRQNGGDVRYYIYLPDGKLLYSVEAADNSRKFYHFDEMGNTTFLTGDDGSVTDTYAITPYGDIADHVGPTDNPFTWQGQYGVIQEASGLYYLRNRHYDASAARFLSPDPMVSSDPRSAEPYAYARGNPLLYIDPFGDFGWGDVGNFFGSVGNGIVNGVKAVGTAVVNTGKAIGSAVVSGVTTVGNFVTGKKSPAPTPHTAPSNPPPAVRLAIPPAGATLRLPLLTVASALQICRKLHTCPQSLVDSLSAVVSNDGGSLISQDGAGIIARLISQDGGGVVSHDGGSFISHDGGSVVSHDGGSVISNDGGSVISNDGGSVISNDGGSVVSNDGGSFISHDGGSFGPGHAN